MKRINITCPACGSRAYLRPASVVYGDKAPDPDAKYYVCGRYPACDCYVAAHRKTMLPMGTLADKALRKKRHDAHVALDSLWKNGIMSRKEAYRLLQLSMGLPAEDAHIAKFSAARCRSKSGIAKSNTERREIMSMEFTLNDLQRQRVEDHLALVEQVLRRSIKTNETVDGMGHDDLYQEGCIALCRAAVSYREEMGAFPAYARTVIRNYLLDRCREIQSARKNLPLLSLDAFAEMGAPEPVSPFHTEDLISDVSSDALLSHFRNRYHGTARLGIEAMELRVRGYSCADIAKLYQKKPNYIGVCISRAAEKLRRERIVREFYTACTEQDIKSA